MSHKMLIFVSAIIAIADGYTLKAGFETVFPVQIGIPNHRVSFQRLNANNELEILICPSGFSFDGNELRCKLMPRKESNGMDVDDLCTEEVNGLVPYPLNCRRFVNCYYGSGTIQPCDAHLLFSVDANYCDWPETSQCCEYVENVRGKNMK